MTPNATLDVYEKQSTGAEYETWTQVGSVRARFRTMTAGQSLNESARLDNRNITHDAICRWDSSLLLAGRVLVRRNDKTQYRIELVTEYGRPLRGGRWQYMRLLLSEERYTVVPT